MAVWRMEKRQVKFTLDALSSAETEDLSLSAERVLKLANKAYLLYVSQDSFEKGQTAQELLSNCSVDAISVTPTHRYPFDLIFERAKSEKWSALLDDFRTLDLPQTES